MADRREQYNDPEESLRMAIEGALSQLWTAMPATVTSVDLTKQTVSCQPAIKGTQTAKDGSTSQVSMPMLVDVPIVWPRAGGYALTFPIEAGDECLVVFASRCIDGWWQSGGEQAPLETRMHDLSDGFAIFGPSSQSRKLTNVQSDGVELRNDDRTRYVKLTDTATSVVDATAIYLDAPTIYVNGNITHTGNQTSSGVITGTTNVVGAGISLSTHVHSGVSPGLNNTGQPE